MEEAELQPQGGAESLIDSFLGPHYHYPDPSWLLAVAVRCWNSCSVLFLFFFLMFFFNFVIESSNLGMHNILFMQIKKKRKAVNLLVKVVFSFSWWKNAQEVQSKKNLLWIIIIIILIFLNSLLCLTPHRALQGRSSVVSDAVRLL